MTLLTERKKEVQQQVEAGDIKEGMRVEVYNGWRREGGPYFATFKGSDGLGRLRLDYDEKAPDGAHKLGVYEPYDGNDFSIKPYRPTTGNHVKITKFGHRLRGEYAKIVKDDRDDSPYKLELLKDGSRFAFFTEDQVEYVAPFDLPEKLRPDAAQEIKEGDILEIVDGTDFPEGTLVKLLEDDSTPRLPYNVEAANGLRQWVREKDVKLVQSVPERPTVGDKVKVVNVGKVGTIVRDDKDGCPYIVEFEDGTDFGYLNENQVVFYSKLDEQEAEKEKRIEVGDRVRLIKSDTRVSRGTEGHVVADDRDLDGTVRFKFGEEYGMWVYPEDLEKITDTSEKENTLKLHDQVRLVGDPFASRERGNRAYVVEASGGGYLFRTESGDTQVADIRNADAWERIDTKQDYEVGDKVRILNGSNDASTSRGKVAEVTKVHDDVTGVNALTEDGDVWIYLTHEIVPITEEEYEKETFEPIPAVDFIKNVVNGAYPEGTVATIKPASSVGEQEFYVDSTLFDDFYGLTQGSIKQDMSELVIDRDQLNGEVIKIVKP